MTVITPPAFLQAGTYTALMDRLHLNTLAVVRDYTQAHRGRQGFFLSRSPLFSNPAGLQIAISACAGIIANTFATDAGEYRFSNPSSTSVTLAAASPTQNRIDVVGFQVKDNFYDASGLNQVAPAVIQGANSAGAPSAPALPLSFIPVVEVLVNATATTPTSMTSRIVRTAPEGTPIPVTNALERNALAATIEGQLIDRIDRDWLERYDGAAWRLLSGAAITSSLVDRDGTITNPVAGNLSIVTSTRWLYQHEGSAWIPFGQVGGRLVTQVGVQGTTAGTTELNFPKLAIENYRVKQNGWYIFFVRLAAQFGASGDSFAIRIRKDTPLSGTIISSFEWIGQVAGFTHSITMALPWQAPADDTDADFYLSAQRIGGGNVLAINGDTRSAIWMDDKGGDAAIWSVVP